VAPTPKTQARVQEAIAAIQQGKERAQKGLTKEV